MPLAQARALFDNASVRIAPFTNRPDQAALRRLAAWAQRLSPTVSVDEASDGLLLDITGCEHIFDSEDQLSHLTLSGLHRLGFRSRAAIAPSIGCAWAVSRFGQDRCTIVKESELRDVISLLPIAALRVRDNVVDQLAHVGIEQIGQLLAMPRSTLPSRFGGELLLRLDQALGQAIETIETVSFVSPPVVERVFDGPTDQVESIAITARELIEEITDKLEQRACGARSLEIELVRSDLEPEYLAITLGRPSRDARHLWLLMRPKLEQAHLGFGVEAVRVRVLALGVIRHEQIQCHGEASQVAATDAERACEEMLDTLSNRLGEHRVLRAGLQTSHLPERAFVMSTINEPPDRMPEKAVPTDRPTVLFNRPLPVDVIALTPDGPVHRVIWNGDDIEVLSCVGPERIGAEWWRARSTTRDYFAACTEDGRWVWLVRGIESDRWCVQGVWA